MKKLAAVGVHPVGISYDKVAVLKEFANAKKISFPLLSDAGSKTIKAYGILKKNGKGLPNPGTFLIDRKGVVRAKLLLEGYRKRHSIDDLIAAGKKLQ